ncbi:class 3 adenylate cyclase/tetratricopeptide (TPR) repeat protein [Rhizobium tibeticum]|uniref:ATP-binding protein n=1 Tax=Rhizobium tibeticum TaxID=501024 RepID=UPI00278990BA|nr:AAA family ATPase [Rhizobium tibeticum]MDP9812700.1 class 3 adenylate cyclase/tetratricopeptide (TPR) repeat protein [Rhizobium tibeticum]
MSDIASWLSRLGLAKYTEAFTANEVDFDALRHLSDEDLKDLGLPVGPRRKILAAIATLVHDTSPTSFPSSPALAPAAREAERRQLTVVFIDLVGSTALSQQLDPEEMRDVFRSYQSAASTEITRYEGYVAKLMGDGVLAYFGWPIAHEDDAERAVRASLAAATATASLTTPLGKPLAARIGIATGLVVVGDLIGEGSAQEQAVVGETPNLAARLQTLAEPSTVVIGDGTHRLVDGLFEMIDLGPQQLKGFAAPVPAWRIIGEADTEGRFDALHRVPTPLVGRSEELELLLRRWQKARTGNGQVVMLSGEPGIGKSRLTAALEERLSVEPHALLRYFCSPYHVNSALYPVIRQLARAARLGRSDSASAKLDKLQALMLQSTPDITEAGPLLAALLSIGVTGRYAPLTLTPQAQKARTLWVLIRQLEGIAARQPIVMVVEDAHWIDPTTRDWLGMVIERLQKLPALLVVTFRPEFRSPWLASPHVTAISLGRLGHDEGAAIVDRVAGGRILPLDVKNQILARTEGVPLFVEELTKTVLESGLLVDAGDRYRLKGPLSSLAIPSTLQDSLMARLDRLASVKNMAQIGACIGRVFHHRLLAAVAGCDAARLRDDLHNLEKSELVQRNGVAPEATYAFKHALVQDAAYQSLLKSRRHQIHAKIASTLQRQFPEVAETEPETLAHHYTAAELADQAAEYWLKAGQQALKRSANVEALVHLDKGLRSVASLPSSKDRLRREIRLHNAMGVAAMAVKGWGAPEVLRAFSSARKLCEKLGDSNELFVAVRGEASYHLISGHLREADDLGRQCLQIAQSANDLDLLLEAHHQSWATKFFLGDYQAAEKHAEWGMATYDPDRDHRLTYIYTGHDPGVCCRSFSAQMLWIRGYPDQALARVREAVALAKRVSHSVSMATALNNLANVHLARREPKAALESAQQQLEVSTKFDLPLMAGAARFNISWALAQQGELAQGVREMREAVEAVEATGADMGMSFCLCVLAQAHGQVGETSEGLIVLEKAFDIVAKSRSKYQVPELMRTKGELLSHIDPRSGAAEKWFRKALTMARAEGTKSAELRAATSLARFYIDQGRGKEGRKLLAPIYAWFTEGFETGDLVDARALLDRMR